MRRRILLALVVAVAAAYAAFGLWVRASRAPRAAVQAGELRGAWHVHTTRSDGRGTLEEVVRAAKEAGLQFVVVADHNVLAPEEQGWHDGVLVVEATEASTRYGHVVALGVPRALDPAERDGDPLGAIARLGGEAVLAHPLHPRRPFSGWGTGPWRGFEVVSNDTAWHEVVARREVAKAVTAAAELPWDRARAVLALQDDPADERARFDAEVAALRASQPRRPPDVLLCSADAHGYPSYRAAFEAFSMHVPVAPTGDGAADARAVAAALLDGRAACVMDGVAPASGVRLARASDASPARSFEPPPVALALSLRAPDLSRARFTLLRDGVRVSDAAAPVPGGDAVVRLPCGGDRCAPGDYRVEATWDGRPWIFTNPLPID